MRPNKVKILCKGYSWAPSEIKNDFWKMNFISTDAEPVPFAGEPLELMQYVKRESLGDIEWNIEELAVSEDGAGKEKFFLCSDFNFDLISKKDLLPGGEMTLADWFMVKVNSTYIKYRLWVQYNYSGQWKTIWTGVIEQDGIEFTESKDNNNGIIKIKAKGFEKQLKEYFEKQPLPEINKIPSWVKYTTYQIKEGAELQQIPYILLSNILSHAFLGTDVNSFYYDFKVNIQLPGLSNYIGADFMVMGKPHYTKYGGAGFEDHQIFYRAGYEYITEETIWGFIKKICNSMGWVFFFSMQQPPNQSADRQLTLCIRDRYYVENGSAPVVLDRNKIGQSGIHWTKGTAEPTVEVIVIPAGQVKGGYAKAYQYWNNSFVFSSPYLWGNKIIVISDGNDLPLNDDGQKIGSLHFSHCDDAGEAYVNFTPSAYAEEINKSDSEYKFRTVGSILPPGYWKTINNIPQWQNERDYAEPDDITDYGYGRKDVLVIDAGTIKTGRMIIASNKEHRAGDFPSEGFDWQGIWFTGNYGMMLGISGLYNPTQRQITYTYEDFIKTENFKNNFLKFRNTHSNITLEVEYTDILCDPMIIFQLDSVKYSLSKLKINLEKELTNLTLTK